MSGRPNPNQAKELLQAATQVRKFDNEIDRLRELIASSQKLLEATEYSRRLNADKIDKLMTAMDCKHSGNTGHEARMVWLLAELVAQAKDKEATDV